MSFSVNVKEDEPFEEYWDDEPDFEFEEEVEEESFSFPSFSDRVQKSSWLTKLNSGYFEAKAVESLADRKVQIITYYDAMYEQEGTFDKDVDQLDPESLVDEINEEIAYYNKEYDSVNPEQGKYSWKNLFDKQYAERSSFPDLEQEITEYHYNEEVSKEIEGKIILEENRRRALNAVLNEIDYSSIFGSRIISEKYTDQEIINHILKREMRSIKFIEITSLHLMIASLRSFIEILKNMTFEERYDLISVGFKEAELLLQNYSHERKGLIQYIDNNEEKQVEVKQIYFNRKETSLDRILNKLSKERELVNACLFSLRKRVEEFSIEEGFYFSASPSGSGKTTFKKLFPFAKDVDDIFLLEYGTFDNMNWIIQQYKSEYGEINCWEHINREQQNILRKHQDKFKNHVLLIHSPNQIPPELLLDDKSNLLILFPSQFNKVRAFESNSKALFNYIRQNPIVDAVISERPFWSYYMLKKFKISCNFSLLRYRDKFYIQ